MFNILKLDIFISNIFSFNILSLNILMLNIFFFFNDTLTTEIYTLSLHDALPIFHRSRPGCVSSPSERRGADPARSMEDRKSTRLNSSHVETSYAVFCLKKKK